MTRIYAKTTFLDGRDRFEAGQEYEASDDKAMYFIAQGWASYMGRTPLWKRVLRRRNG